MRPELPDDLHDALEIFNMMGGIEWSAIPVVFPLFNVTDPQRTILRLAIIRDALNTPRDG